MDITEMRAWLGDLGTGLYILPDGPASAVHGGEGHYLVRDGRRWLVCYSERGQTSDLTYVDSEEKACLEVLDRLGPAYGALLRPPGISAPKALQQDGEEPVDLQIALTAREPHGLREAVRDWLTETTARLYGDGFAPNPGPTPMLGGRRLDRPVRLRLSGFGSRRESQAEHRGGDWLAAFDTLWRDEHTTVTLGTSSFTRDGKLTVHEIQVHRERDGWLHCSAVRFGGATAGEPHRWAEFLAEQAAKRQADYGHVTPNEEHPRSTNHERTLGATRYESRTRSDEHLRGWGWATACGPGATKTLGGKAAVESTGVFAEVRNLPHGGLLMIAKAELGTAEADKGVEAALGPALVR